MRIHPFHLLAICIPCAGVGAGMGMYVALTGSLSATTRAFGVLLVAISAGTTAMALFFTRIRPPIETSKGSSTVAVFGAITTIVSFVIPASIGIPALRELSQVAILAVASSFFLVHVAAPHVPAFPSPRAHRRQPRAHRRPPRKTDLWICVSIPVLLVCLTVPALTMVSDPLPRTFWNVTIWAALVVTLYVSLFFLHWRFVLAALIPPAITFSATLLLTAFISHPSHWGLFLVPTASITTSGHWALLYVRSYQRYAYRGHAHIARTRWALGTNAVLVCVGSGILWFAAPSSCRELAVPWFFASLLSFPATCCLVPPLLRLLIRHDASSTPVTSPASAVLIRYRHAEAFPRYFARFKIRCDCLFAELPPLLDSLGRLHTIIDIGTGYGVPACWLAQVYPDATVYGIEPDENRVRVAHNALRDRGYIVRGAAPDIPPLPGPADVAMLLDMMHYLPQSVLALTLARLRRHMRPGARLVIRTVVPNNPRFSLSWWHEHTRLRIAGVSAHYRSAATIAAAIRTAGFGAPASRASRTSDQLVWFAAEVPQ